MKNDDKTNKIEGRLYEKVVCGCKFQELEESISKKLVEELAKKKETDDMAWIEESKK